jgi:GTP-binding protein
VSSNVPVVAVIGRTNVGKSSLCNAILGYRSAIVDDTPGVTRDRQAFMVNRYEFPFWLVDTGGVVGDEDKEMEPLVRDQAEIAIKEADIILCVFDGISGPQESDREVVRLLRGSGKRILYVVNKCEKQETKDASVEFYGLGIDEPFLVSAAHRQGIGALVARIKDEAIALGKLKEGTVRADKGIRVSLVGKPNVGKSTLVNTLLGKKRVVVANKPGTTRDSIEVSVMRDGQLFTVIDTAGLRRKANIEDGTVERYSSLRTTKSIAGSDVVVLILDATEGIPSDQDKKIATLAHEKGKGLIIVLNKWDIVEEKSTKAFEAAVRDAFKFAHYAPILFVSALTGKNCPNILDLAKEVYESRMARLPTAKLNRTIEAALRKVPPPVYRASPIKFFFSTQIGVSPPTIVIFCNYPKGVSPQYQRYLLKAIRDEFPLKGTEIRVLFRKKSEKGAQKEKANEVEEIEYERFDS